MICEMVRRRDYVEAEGGQTRDMQKIGYRMMSISFVIFWTRMLEGAASGGENIVAGNLIRKPTINPYRTNVENRVSS